MRLLMLLEEKLQLFNIEIENANILYDNNGYIVAVAFLKDFGLSITTLFMEEEQEKHQTYLIENAYWQLTNIKIAKEELELALAAMEDQSVGRQERTSTRPIKLHELKSLNLSERSFCASR